MNWMIYGANGYTGELIAREAARRGLKPIVAGRRAEPIERLANELGLQARVFSLDTPAEVAGGLDNVALVLHCAGPFSTTAIPMIEGCLRAGVHYLDITGEIPVFEYAHSTDVSRRARESDVIICPGVGFDVVPTDCLALKLKELLPDATRLSLGFETRSGLSRGTAQTVIEGLAEGCLVRRNGVIHPVPMGSLRRKIDFGRGPRSAMTIPWGDVSTAYYTTSIPNVDTWVPMPTVLAWGARLLDISRPLLSSNWVQGKLKNLVKRYIKGPNEQARERQPTRVWGEVRNREGTVKTARIKVDNLYSFTVNSALAVVANLEDDSTELSGGSYTPAMLFGSDFVESLPGSDTFQIEAS